MKKTGFTSPQASVSKGLLKRGVSEDKQTYAMSQLEMLLKRREIWEEDFQRSNHGLYPLLSDLYELFLTTFVEVTEKERKALKVLLIKKMKEKGANVLEKTLVLTMFIRYVFNAPTKRALIYGNVIKSAISHGIKPEHLSDWIVREGGIEEVSKKTSLSARAIEKINQLNKVKLEVIAEIESNTANQIKPIDIHGLSGKYALIVVKPDIGKCFVGGTYSDIPDNFFETLLTLMARQRLKGKSNELNSGDRDLLLSAGKSDHIANQTITV
jgi:hypothetical protein